jgi:hypothetical protein
MRHIALLLLALSTCLAQTPLSARTYEVAQTHPQADDAGPGTAEHPWRTLGKAAASVQAGDRVLIRSGIYREQVLVGANGTAEQPIRFEAAAGERVVLTGADRLTGWVRSNEKVPLYTIPWPHRFNTYSKTMTHPGDEYHRLIGRCEQVFVNGYPLRQVLSSNQLALGTFLAETSQATLYVWSSANQDLQKALVEASVRPEILRLTGAHVQVRGLRFRYAANAAQRGAVILAGKEDLLEDCVVEETNASGAAFRGEDVVVRRCTFRDNGQLGFGANRAHRLLLTECLVENNNTKNFERGWEAGGNKLALCRGAVLEKSRFVRNRGNGIWFDIGNEDCTVRQCLIADNDDAGIFYEISYGLHAHDNVIVGNGFASTAGAWGAQAGMCLSSSPGAVIERNLLVGNREGFNFREQSRATPTIADRASRAVWNHDELIRNNVIAYNREAQVWGWFDVLDDRHWPEAPRDNSIASAAPESGKLNLRELNLQFEDNVYFANSNQGWFNWGTTWRRHQVYPSLQAFQKELGIDRGSRVLDPVFADVLARDFRLRPERLSILESQYPRGTVPGVLVGVLDRESTKPAE